MNYLLAELYSWFFRQFFGTYIILDDCPFLFQINLAFLSGSLCHLYLIKLHFILVSKYNVYSFEMEWPLIFNRHGRKKGFYIHDENEQKKICLSKYWCLAGIFKPASWVISKAHRRQKRTSHRITFILWPFTPRQKKRVKTCCSDYFCYTRG